MASRLRLSPWLPSYGPLSTHSPQPEKPSLRFVLPKVVVRVVLLVLVILRDIVLVVLLAFVLSWVRAALG